MTESSNVGLFPGILDPDGRPWTWGKFPERYRDAIVWFLKAAMLTQEHLVIPCGYFFDNPAFQSVLWEYTGQSQEAKCFKALFPEFVRVGFDGAMRTLASLDDWVSLLDQWIEGSTSERNVRAFPNLLREPRHLRKILIAQSTEDYRAQLVGFGNAENGTDLQKLLARLAKMQFQTSKPPARFDFGERVDRAIAHGPDIPTHKKTFEKVESIVLAVRKHGLPRISRSILQNPHLAKDLGIPDQLIITPAEYRARLALPMRHWHHLAFASAYALGAVCSETAPKKSNAVTRTISAVTDKISESEPGAWYKISTELSSVGFADILIVRRNNEHKFRKGLRQMRLGIEQGDDEFLDAFHRHWRNVISAISWNFKKPETPEIDTLLGTVRDSVSPGEGQVQAVAKGTKFLFSLAVPLVPKVRKEAQLRWFFRQVRRSRQAQS